MSAINILQYMDRARIISVPFSKYVRDSDTANMTLHVFANTLEDSYKIEANDFIKDLFQKFDYAFFGFDRDPEKVSVVDDNRDPKFIQSNILEELTSIKQSIDMLSPHKHVLEGSNFAVDNELILKIDLIAVSIKDTNESINKLSSLEKLTSAFASPSFDTMLEEVKEKFSKNTKTYLTILLFSTVLLPIIGFSLVGYYFGAEKRKDAYKSEFESQARYANDLARDLVKKGATDALVFGRTPGSDTISIMCNEKNNRCTTRYDFGTKQGIIEIK
jgi:hypothetical protein